MKNIRSQIYPSSQELYQLLNKARILQEAHPDQPIAPVFVCRKTHRTSFWMAQQLGFLIIERGAQFAGTVEDEETLHKVRIELHFQDLLPGNGPSLRVRDRFRDTLPKYAATYAAKWQKTVANLDLADCIRQLKSAKNYAERSQLMALFREHVKRAGHLGF
ncbi:hypothetical protein [Saccharopolyspora hattusasensis]|uniref:hypothetical protein n=1 Tax=Saccharopolyspora hattusasensis TaxID=1128679 RepID=UPI003D951D37